LQSRLALEQNVMNQPDRLAGFDFETHNQQVRRLWDDFNAGRPTRTPAVVGTNTRYFMFHPDANPRGLSFRAYSEDPEAMFHALLQFNRWTRFNVLQDQQLGLPDGWEVNVDFQNYYEAGWFGCAVHYMDGQVPDTRPDFADCPVRLLERGVPDSFAGLAGRCRDYRERFLELARGAEFCGRPVKVGQGGSFLGTDGPMTVACNLFGPEFVCTSMAEEPQRLHRLLAFITEATIARIQAWCRYVGATFPRPNYGFADDSVALISTPMYREHVLPHHRRLCAALAAPGPRGIHLCGDATRHFVTIRDELNVHNFDTGFPVDFAGLRAALGPGVRLQGGPHVEFLRSQSPAAVYEETRRILQSGVRAGGRFVLREGNNLAPGTPLENTEAMYRAGLKFGATPEP
jgi:uroporphyrinogen-III decarboxylase